MIFESFFLTVSAPTLNRLEPAIRKLAEDEWEDERVQKELGELANELWSRLQRIGVGDIQQQSVGAIK